MAGYNSRRASDVGDLIGQLQDALENRPELRLAANAVVGAAAGYLLYKLFSK